MTVNQIAIQRLLHNLTRGLNVGKNRWKIVPDIPPICRIHARIAGIRKTHLFPFKICLIQDNPASYPFKEPPYIYTIIYYIYVYIYTKSTSIKDEPDTIFNLEKGPMNILSTQCPLQNRAITISSLRSHSTIPAVWFA